MNFFDGRHYKINKFFLSLIGQWPYQTIQRKYVCLIILFLLSGTQIIAKLCATISSFYDINVIMEDMAPLICDAVGIIKLVNSVVQMKTMRKLLNHIKTDYASLSIEDEIKIMNSYAEGGRKFTIMYSGLFAMTLMCFVIPPLKAIFFNNINGTSERPLVHHVEYFIDPNNYYYPIILHSYLTIFIVIFTIVAMDTMFVVLVQHACGLFTALGHRICEIIDNDVITLDINPPKSEDKHFKNIIRCIHRHQKAIEFVNLLESYYSKSFFVQAGFNMIVISITGLQSITATETNNFFQQISVFYSSLAHIFFECTNGQRLINHSGRIHEYLINMEWYKTSFRTRKLFQFMLVRSRVSCKLTAANLLDISMETFSAIVRMSISYFTMLRSMQ